MPSVPNPNPGLSPEALLAGYARGVFPMADQRDDPTLFWVDPRQRGVIPLDGLKVSHSLAKTVRHGGFEVRCNTAFATVIAACAESVSGREQTWINPEIESLFITLHHRGWAHSVECWRDDQLLGGLYGLAIGRAFCGESMFSRASDASKVALVHLVARLRAGGFSLLDTQFITPHLARLGAIEIPRAEYHRRLAVALEGIAHFPHQLQGDVLGWVGATTPGDGRTSP